MSEKIHSEVSKAEPVIGKEENGSVHSGTLKELHAADIVHAAEGEFAPDEYHRLLRKIDLVLLPIMWVSR